MSDRFFIRLFAVFGILNGVLMLLKPRLLDISVHVNVLLVGNLLLALVTLFSYWLCRKGLTSTNNHAFVRMVYASTLSKMMLCLIGITAYVLINRPDVSKATIFILMFLYLVYTVFETLQLFRLTRKKT
jgi:hypothetical protein